MSKKKKYFLKMQAELKRNNIGQKKSISDKVRQTDAVLSLIVSFQWNIDTIWYWILENV